MAQTGYTPISIYNSATTTNVPTAGNLVAGELAINTADGKLFYKDSSGVVQTMASKATTAGTYSSITTSNLTIGTTQLGAGDASIMKNRIINGAMAIWQRGTSGFTTNSNYSADRWIIQAGTSLSTGAQSSDVPSGFKYSLSIAGTNVPQAAQRIESNNCTDLVGQSVTVSFWVKQTSGTSMYASLYYANTADTFSSTTQIGSTATFTSTSSWAQYTTTFTNLPSGSANGLQLVIGANTAGSAAFLITGVQLEVGSSATGFEYVNYQTSLANCQRYYITVGGQTANQNFTMMQAYSTTNFNGGTVGFPVFMRANPTFSYSSLSHFYVQNAAGSGIVPTAISQDGAEVSLSCGSIRGTVTAGLIAGNASPLFAASTSARLNWSAEL